MDGTSLRTVRVYKSTTRFQHLVREWRQKNPRKQWPAYFLLHVRLLGVVQRSDTRKLCVALAEQKLVQPKSVPPTESVREILSSQLLRQVRASSTLMADGAAAWSAAAATYQKKKFTVLHVKHSKAEFVLRRAGRSAGTQSLDRCWDVLKRTIPKEAKSRQQTPDGFEILNYVFATLWRRQAEQPLLAALGKLCKQRR